MTAAPSLESLRSPSQLRQALNTFKQIKLPDGLDAIGAGWFRDTVVECVFIPSSVRAIGDNAFSGCKKLQKV